MASQTAEALKDALQQEMKEVQERELMGAADQAKLLSSMMTHATGLLYRAGCSGRELTGLPNLHEAEHPGTLHSKPGLSREHGDQNKWQRPSAKGNARTSNSGSWWRDHQSQQSGRRRAQGSQPTGNWQGNPARERMQRSDPNWISDSERGKTMSLCLSLERLVLRHEDQLGINRAQDNYIMFAQTQGLLSAVPEFYVATEAWRTMKKEQPELLTLPLRAWLLKHWVDLVLKRMEMVMTSSEAVQQARDMLILDEELNG